MTRQIITQTLIAIMFLSRWPLQAVGQRLSIRHLSPEFEQTARYFGPAALLIGLLPALVIWLAGASGFSPLVSATLAVITLVATTGALHEDAIADVADGFGGGKTRQQKLKIMRDSRIGTYGACALVLTLILSIGILAQLMERGGAGFAASMLIAANVISTSLMVWPWANLPAARGEGLSTKFGLPSPDTAIFSALLGHAIALLFLWPTIGLVNMAFVLAVCWMAMFAFSALCRVQIGGHTGDTLGATKKILDLTLLLAIIVVT